MSQSQDGQFGRGSFSRSGTAWAATGLSSGLVDLSIATLGPRSMQWLLWSDRNGSLRLLSANQDAAVPQDLVLLSDRIVLLATTRTTPASFLNQTYPSPGALLLVYDLAGSLLRTLFLESESLEFDARLAAKDDKVVLLILSRNLRAHGEPFNQDDQLRANVIVLDL